MPELPEVENVRLPLMTTIIGRTVEHVEVRRASVVQPAQGPRRQRFKRADGKLGELHLLQGQTFTNILRQGKQLLILGSWAIDAQGNPVIEGDSIDTAYPAGFLVHLGMTGSLRFRLPEAHDAPHPHTHVIWHLDNGGQLVFRDPRRFGGIWTLPSTRNLWTEIWRDLGPDALTVNAGELSEVLKKTRRNIKAALLDQSIVAGLGNIYVDESLFAAGIHPQTPAHRLQLSAVQRLVACARKILEQAVASRGSTLRDYVDGSGLRGHFQLQHRVYGRSGQNCVTCDKPLKTAQIGGRTTVYCANCQKRSTRV